MNQNSLRNQWNEQGFIVIPQLLETAEVRKLQMICDRIFQDWLQESSTPEQAANFTNLAFLTEPRYFIHHPEELPVLLNAIVNPKILDILNQIVDEDLLFHNTQYFFNPANHTRAGDWHRDQQFDAPDEDTEKVRMKQSIGIHVHIALIPDSNLEYIPGSHQRWDTPQEREIRKGLNGKKPNSSAIPNATRIHLNSGDGVFFDAWGIHRGNYIADVPRRTFDIIYGTLADWCPPPPTCFLQPNILQGLTLESQNFFKRLINVF